MFTKKDLTAHIAALGIKPTDTVMIHTSMRAIGEVEGGTDGVIDAFRDYLTDGLFLVPTHTWAAVTEDQPVYDVRTTVPDIGALPRAAAFRTDGIRSLHPTHSMWGVGKDAADYMKGEELAPTPGAPGFAWARLYERDTKILLIGVDNRKNTFIHSVEEFADIPDRMCHHAYEITAIDRSGNAHRHPFTTYYCSKCDDVSHHFDNFEKPFTATGAQYTGRFGNAEVRVVDARKCRDVLLRIFSRADRDVCIGETEIPEAWYL